MELCTISVKQLHDIPYPVSHSSCTLFHKDIQKITEFETTADQLHTLFFLALYLISVHNIAPTYLCSHGNVMYNNQAHFLPNMCILLVCNKQIQGTENTEIQMFSFLNYRTV
jgi:hypothetical protein